MKRMILFSVMAGSLVAAGIASAQFPVDDPAGPRGRGPGKQVGGPGGERGPAGGGRYSGQMNIDRLLANPEIIEKLGLTDEQIKTLKEKQYTLRKKRIDLRAEMEKAALEQARLLTDENSSEEAILDAVRKTGKIRTELAVVGMRQLLVFREVLTKEQREKVQQLMRRRARGKYRHFARPRGGGPGGREGVQRPGPRGRRPGFDEDRPEACPGGRPVPPPPEEPAPPPDEDTGV